MVRGPRRGRGVMSAALRFIARQAELGAHLQVRLLRREDAAAATACLICSPPASCLAPTPPVCLLAAPVSFLSSLPPSCFSRLPPLASSVRLLPPVAPVSCPSCLPPHFRFSCLLPSASSRSLPPRASLSLASFSRFPVLCRCLHIPLYCPWLFSPRLAFSCLRMTCRLVFGQAS